MANHGLGALIDALAKTDPNLPIKHGFGKPMSYRGYYDQLAFEPVMNTTIGEMLAHARSAFGKSFDGYKGGEYLMHEWTECWIAKYGASAPADAIGPTLLSYWTGVNNWEYFE